MVVLAALVLLVALSYHDVLNEPFFSDDYMFLDKVRGASFSSLWAPYSLAYGYYRPWSRELHYWAIVHAFGVRPLPFHVASFVLWLAVMLQLFAFVRRNAGERTATLATCGVAAMTAWSIPIRWGPAA